MKKTILKSFAAAAAIAITGLGATAAFADAKVTLTYQVDANWIKDGERALATTSIVTGSVTPHAASRCSG